MNHPHQRLGITAAMHAGSFPWRVWRPKRLFCSFSRMIYLQICVKTRAKPSRPRGRTAGIRNNLKGRIPMRAAASGLPLSQTRGEKLRFPGVPTSRSDAHAASRRVRKNSLSLRHEMKMKPLRMLLRNHSNEEFSSGGITSPSPSDSDAAAPPLARAHRMSDLRRRRRCRRGLN